MKNNIILTGIIKDKTYSHTTQGIDYYKANLYVNDFDNPIIIKFKENNWPSDDILNSRITIYGSLRSYSYKLENGKNRVELYVFTYFDNYFMISTDNNKCSLIGNICKLDKPRIDRYHNNDKNLHFILENTIESSSGYMKAYIPCIVKNDNIDDFISQCSLYDSVYVEGEFIPRTYKKFIDEQNYEEHIAYEVIVNNFNNQ